jgi:hypothetical protein
MGLRPEALPRNTSDMRDTIQAAPISQATNAPIQYHIDSHLLPLAFDGCTPGPPVPCPRPARQRAPASLRRRGPLVSGKLHPMTTCPQRQIGVQWSELVLAQPSSPWKATIQRLRAQYRLVVVVDSFVDSAYGDGVPPWRVDMVGRLDNLVELVLDKSGEWKYTSSVVIGLTPKS